MEEARNVAYVTFVMCNDSYVPGALVLGYSLLKQGCSVDLVCLISDQVSEEAVQCLKAIYTKVILIEEIRVRHDNHSGRQDRPYLFTRFQALRLGKGGGLGCDYERIILLDADVLALRNMDELFQLDVPAGIINECKDHWTGHSRYDASHGKCIWHEVYEEICPHGTIIPKTITDRVWEQPENMGVNACLWVLEPSIEDHKCLMNLLKCPEVLRRIQRFKWPEMQLATAYYSGRWTSVDLRYCAYNAQPGLEHVFSTHFAGMKPWQLKNEKSLKHYLRHQDYRLWYQSFREMALWVYPELSLISKHQKIIRFYEKAVEK